MSSGTENNAGIIERFLRDEVWFKRGNPEFPEHDAEGFRNVSDAEGKDLFITGDSWTYGMQLEKEQSWPMLLSSRGLDVYNASAGGWGIFEYLMATRKYLTMRSKVCLVAIYTGNDLVEAFGHLKKSRSSIRQEFWQPHYDGVRANVMGRYRINGVKLQKILDTGVSVEKAFAIANETDDIDISTGHVDGEGPFVFRPELRQEATSTDTACVAAGMEIAKACISQIVELCEEMGVEPFFMILPCKESIFAHLVDEEDLRERLIAVRENEARMEEELRNFLDQFYVPLFSAYDSLQSVAVECFHTNTLDGHPKSVGAVRIADLVWNNLKKSLEDYDSNSYPLE